MELRKLSASKLAPWNWFRDENEERNLEIQRVGEPAGYAHPLMRLHREIDRLFEETFGNAGFPSLSGGAESARHGLLLRPSVDIMEEKEQYRISVEVPGIKEEDLQLSLDQDRLIISGEKRSEYEDRQEGQLHRVERSNGRFQRVLTLPGDALGDKASARFDKGILTITVPRDGSRPDDRRVIEIKSGSH